MTSGTAMRPSDSGYVGGTHRVASGASIPGKDLRRGLGVTGLASNPNPKSLVRSRRGRTPQTFDVPGAPVAAPPPPHVSGAVQVAPQLADLGVPQVSTAVTTPQLTARRVQNVALSSGTQG